MNKTMAFVAVALTLVTAFFLANTEGADGDLSDYQVFKGGYYYYEVNDDNLADYDGNFKSRMYINLTDLGDTFKGDTDIGYVILGPNVTSIPDGAFKSCTGLVAVDASYVTTVGSNAFSGCSNLSSIKFSDKLTTVGISAFMNCSHLHGPILTGTSVTTLPATVFKNSGIWVEDLRNITSIHNLTFTGSSVKGVIMNKGQDSIETNIPAIYIGDFDFNDPMATEAGGVYYLEFQVSDGLSLQSTDSEGNVTKYNSDKQTWVTTKYYCKLALGETITIDPVVYHIHYPAGMGLDDVQRRSGTGNYTLSTPTDGIGLFLGWEVDGLDGYVTTMTELDFVSAGTDINPVPKYGNATVTFDHSQVFSSSQYSSLPASKTFTYGDTYPTLADIPGYEFSGWSVNEVHFDGGSKITTYSDHTALSEWNSTTFTLTTVDYNDAESSRQVTAGSTVDLEGLDYTEPENLRFMGWSLTDNGTVLTSNPTMNEDMKLYSVFSNRTQYTVSYKDGSTVLSTQTGYDGRTIVADAEDPESEGKVFLYWVMDGTHIYDGDNILITGDIDIYAVWSTVKLNLRYHLDGLEVTVHDYGSEVTLDADPGENEGFTFGGWAIRSNGSIVYGFEETVTMTTDIDLYPVWIKLGKFPVTLVRFIGSPFTTYVEEGSEYTIPSTVVRSNYTFMGWATEADGDAVYQPRDTVTVDSSLYLYEVWKENESFIVTTHDYSDNESSTKVYKDETYTVPTVSLRQGYTFSGWATTSNGTSAYRSGQEITVTANTDLYELWAEDVKERFTVTLHDHTGATSSTEIEDGKSYTIPAHSTYDDHTFGGWSTTTSGTRSYDSGDSITVTRNMDLYEIWTENSRFKVTVHSDPSVERYAYEGRIISVSLPTMTRSGYDFLGWSTSYNSTSATYTAPRTIPVSETTDFYPVWAEKARVTVKIHLKGTDYENKTTYAGESLTLPDSVGTENGRTHEGWTTNSNGTGSFYAVKSVIYPTSSMELFTYWSDPEMVRLTFKDGNETITGLNIVKTTEYNLSDVDEPEKVGYRFKGWSNSPSATIPGYSSGIVTVNSDTTLYAVWERLMKITFNDGDDTDEEYLVKNSAVTLRTLTKDGYEFKGWGKSITSDSVITSLIADKDYDLYAKWEEIPKTTDISITDTEVKATDTKTDTEVKSTEDKTDTKDTDVSYKDPGTVTEAEGQKKSVQDTSSNASEYPILVDSDGESTGGSNRTNLTAVGIGAVVAVLVTSIVLFQIRRN